MDTAPRTAAVDDAASVSALAAGDEAAFARLVDLWSPAMLRVARHHVSTDASAEEVVQDTWLAVLRGLDRFEGRSSLRTWAFRILVNTAKTRGVRERRTVPMSALETDDGPTVDPSRFRGPGDAYPGGWKAFPSTWPTPDEGVLGSDARRVVAAAVATLPDRQRAVVTLRDVHGFGAEEVCTMLGLSPGNQRVLLHRARAAVRAHLELHFGAAARWGATP